MCSRKKIFSSCTCDATMNAQIYVTWLLNSSTTVDVLMFVYSIWIYVMKRVCCILTIIDWLLQTLSVITRESWGNLLVAYHNLTGPIEL